MNMPELEWAKLEAQYAAPAHHPKCEMQALPERACDCPQIAARILRDRLVLMEQSFDGWNGLLYGRAIKAWGREAQLNQAQEELAELIVAINHLRRDRPGARESVAEECADVQLMAGQIAAIIGVELVNKVRADKVERLDWRLRQEGK